MKIAPPQNEEPVAPLTCVCPIIGVGRLGQLEFLQLF